MAKFNRPVTNGEINVKNVNRHVVINANRPVVTNGKIKYCDKSQ